MNRREAANAVPGPATGHTGHTACRSSGSTGVRPDADKARSDVTVGRLACYCLSSARSRLFGRAWPGLGSPVGAEQPIPKEVDDSEIAVGMQVMDKMQLLHMPEPGEAS